MKKIYSKILVTAALVASTTMFSSCELLGNMSNMVVISGTGVVNHEATVEMESTLQLSCTEKISGMNDVVWKSDDESIAKVDPRSGVVTPVAPGRVRIIVYTDTDIVPQSDFDFVFITVVGKSLGVIDDGLDQSEAD